MFVLIVIPVALLGWLLVTVWQSRHRDDLIRRRTQAFATLRQMVESPPTHANGLSERTPVLSDHVRILSARPAGMPRSQRQLAARRTRSSTPRRRPTTKTHPKIAVIPDAASVPSSPGETPKPT